MSRQDSIFHQTKKIQDALESRGWKIDDSSEGLTVDDMAYRYKNMTNPGLFAFVRIDAQKVFFYEGAGLEKLIATFAFDKLQLIRSFCTSLTRGEHGGTRKGSGRKSAFNGMPCKSIRLPVEYESGIKSLSKSLASFGPGGIATLNKLAKAFGPEGCNVAKMMDELADWPKSVKALERLTKKVKGIDKPSSKKLASLQIKNLQGQVSILENRLKLSSNGYQVPVDQKQLVQLQEINKDQADRIERLSDEVQELRAELLDVRQPERLLKAGFRLLRSCDSYKHIKIMTESGNGWKIIEKGFASKAAMNRRLKELLDDDMTLTG